MAADETAYRSATTAADLSHRKKIVFWLVMIGVVAGVAEVASFFSASVLARSNVIVFRDSIPEAIKATRTASPRMYTSYEPTYDRDLGWVNVRGLDFYGEPDRYSYDASGAREAPRPFATTLMSAYGDSFTHGDSVNADETWIQQLALRFQTNALNFGVGGYATDQAVLRVEKNARAGLITKVVLLGLMSENINRTMGSFRAFYTNDRCIPCATNGPKPFFRKTAGGWKLAKIGSEPTIKHLWKDLQKAEDLDYWYQQVSFPYSVGLIRYFARRHTRQPVVRQWDNPEARERMSYLLSRFHGLSEEYDFWPVVVFIPEGFDFWSVLQGKRPSYRPFLDAVAHSPDLKKMTFVDILEDGKFHEEYLRYGRGRYGYGGHPSAEGCRIIANAVAARISGLMQRLGAPPPPSVR